MKYYLIAGEPSGDLHGANLIRGLRKADPDAQFRFWGGDLMADAGGKTNLRKHYRETSFFGVVQSSATWGPSAARCASVRTTSRLSPPTS